MGRQWKRQLLSTLIVASNFCQIFAQNYNDATADLEGFEFPETDTYPHDFQKRLSKFVRIGRGLSSFIRIGRQSPDEELDFYQSDDIPNAINDDLGDSRNSAFYELDPDSMDNLDKRLSSFVRIGRNYNARNELEEHNNVKRGGTFIRMGKFPSSAYVRNRPGRVNGFASQPYYRRTGRIGHSSFIRIGKRDTSDAYRRMLEQNTKYGTSQPDLINEKEASTDTKDRETEDRRYLKIGRDVETEHAKQDEENKKATQDQEAGNHSAESPRKSRETFDKRLSHFVRIGRGDTPSAGFPFDTNGAPDVSAMPKYLLASPSAYGNSGISSNGEFGSFIKSGPEAEIAKRRMSSFVRIGKSSTPLENSAERLDSFLTNDENMQAVGGDIDKRISSFVRIGKSPERLDDDIDKRISSFVRIGKSGNEFGNDLVKRISSFVRIGRNNPYSENEFNKRLSSFIRVGKNFPDLENDQDKRFSSFVRIGKNSPTLTDRPDKRISSFVRIGKNIGELDDSYNKRLSSFIRVGKDIFDVSKDLENEITDTVNAADSDVNKRVLSTFVRIGKNVDKSEKSN